MLSNYEKETVITFNSEESFAYVYTCHTSWMKRLDKNCIDFPSLYKLIKKDEFSKTYIVPKKYIHVGKPSPNKGKKTP